MLTTRPLALLAALLSLAAAARAADRPVPARTAILAQSGSSPAVEATPVDWSGYRGIRRYAYLPYGPYPPPYYYARSYYGLPYYALPYYRPYAPYPPFYYGHYYHRPWYASPYAYNSTYRYPSYAPRYHAGPACPLPSPLAAPHFHGLSSTAPIGIADETGEFYW